MDDSASLERFVKAQNQDSTYQRALSEIQNGRKTSHWIWYVFPQIVGLGISDMSVYYGIKNRAEAQAYLAHPVLGPRLHEVAQALLDLPKKDPVAVLGSLDALKVCSSMTLFLAIAPKDPIFQSVIDTLYGGQCDKKTLQLLHESDRRSS
ncbi:MAG: DUF1810 domain-containing protein [Desulfovibrionaceae bacterium]|nr:DUF1810 domain-containing protein [Desulfovibrionaceae bacterium]